jgi:hypothetical protein
LARPAAGPFQLASLLLLSQAHARLFLGPAQQRPQRALPLSPWHANSRAPCPPSLTCGTRNYSVVPNLPPDRAEPSSSRRRRTEAAHLTPISSRFSAISPPINAIKLTTPLCSSPSPSQRHQTSSQLSKTLAQASKFGFHPLVVSPPLSTHGETPSSSSFYPCNYRIEPRLLGPFSCAPASSPRRRQWQAPRGLLPGHENGTGEVAITPASSPCFWLVKPWPLGPISLAPVSSVAAGNGRPP